MAWRVARAAVALLAFGWPAQATEVGGVDLPSPVRRLVVSGDEIVVETRSRHFFQIVDCKSALVCAELTASVPKTAEQAPEGGLSDGLVATLTSGDIRRAWYAHPTARYDHGVLGNSIEAGGLVAEDARGRRYDLRLPSTHVFEDLTPRLVDLDGDGTNEIVTIRSSLSKGSAIAIYGVREGHLRLLDATKEIGRRNRWLNPAPVANYLPGESKILPWVETPHIGGTLKMAVFRDGRLRQVAEPRGGFSNHVIGSRELGMSAAHDFDGDGVMELVLPSADRRSIRIVSGSKIKDIALRGKVSHAIAIRNGVIVTATEDGTLTYAVP